MATVIRAGNTTEGALVSSDTTGILELKTGTGSGTSVDFTGIPSWVKRITVAIQGLSFAGSTGQARVQIGTGGSLTASGYTSGTFDAGTINILYE